MKTKEYCAKCKQEIKLSRYISPYHTGSFVFCSQKCFEEYKKYVLEDDTFKPIQTLYKTDKGV